jgi:hypothetical protein
MSETLLDGSGEGTAPPSGGEGAGSGNTEGQQQEGQKQEGQQQEGQQQQPAPADWMAKYQGEDLGWLQNRGLTGKSADEAIRNLYDGQRHAEKRLGVPADRLLALPQDASSEGAMDPVWDALGRPKDAAGYEIDPGDTTETQAFAEVLGNQFHAAGLTKDQGEAVVAAMEDFFGAEFDKSEASTQEARAANLAKLKEEWGGDEAGNFDLNIQLAKEAAKQTGATEAEINALSAAFSEETGDADVIRFFNRIGQKLGGEDPFISGASVDLGIGATTPEAAAAKISEMKTDPKFAAALKENNPDNPLVKQYRALLTLRARG